MSTSGKRRGSHLAWRHKTVVQVSALTLAWCLFGAAPASAQYYGVYGFWHRPKHHAAKRVSKETAKQENKDPFGNIPKGPLQIFVSIDQQKLHLYGDGVHVADTSVATGVPSLPTPLGVFSVIQKQVFHRSNIYSNAPMPFMQRITWSGVALHEGESIGHRASHGCIRMPHDFAVRLYHLTKLGVPVYVANGELKPADFADPHLFVHRDEPPAPAPAAAPAMTNAAPATPSTAASPTALGLRVGADGPALAPTAIADAARSDPPVSDAPQSAAAASTQPIEASAAKADPPGDPPQSAAAPVKSPVEAAAAASPDSKAGPTVAAPAPAASAVVPNVPAPATATLDPSVPMPPAEPASLIKTAPPSKAPIAIFISRKEKKIYVRQDFAPLFQAPVTIADPDHPFGTVAFTALDYTSDDHTTLRWDVVEFPAEPPKVKHKIERETRYERFGHGRRRIEVVEQPADPTPPETPAEALARIAIPQEAIDYISQLIVPGSTLIISDHGLGDETGEGTNFIVVTR